MTPKQKANYLVNSFIEFASDESEFFGKSYINCLQNAKQCALIAVELLIDCTHSEDIVIEQIGANGRDRNAKYTYEYWNQVKTEINLL